MLVGEKSYQTVWMEGTSVFMIEQNLLPFEFRIHECPTYWDTCMAITEMVIRGAGAIGAAAGFAMAQAFLMEHDQDQSLIIREAKHDIESTRPTAKNLFYAVDRVYRAGLISPENALVEAQKVARQDESDSKKIGEIGSTLIGKKANILTHCNAGWLAFVDYGTALAPIYLAQSEGKEVFVYVDETRPRGQGARLTAWELFNANIPHVIIPDNAAAYLMAAGKIDMVIVGADRIAANGDVANKIGTFGRAILAREFGVPFYVAAPTSTFDLECKTGKGIPIEERSQDEVLYQTGTDSNGNLVKVLVCSPGSEAYNPAFDVTPAKYITGIITEKGLVKAHHASIKKLMEDE
ncbi:MAG: S-methyl-5-thioribose-1-phosphate isomerase [Bacteroidetes bacterium CG18_big_fil_WC_8_21_14_2_50_41_14]|nr:MAG: S-methyl-5-thioribose-1-phosphate isomerase [Bacteroidetes bacterium CG18_big_fil_WC_8_21_14_2_50_41_14]PJB57313.1 MAG: S-methyl-5-thioribose-1-phosphate isomerase [Bacteroidetes bacterium CG_4_9_14_3_um_filter_41_19]